MANSPSTIVITGASSGIGEALAKIYAASGVTLGLLGRDRERLNRIAEECTKRGAAVETGMVDVRDKDAMEQWLCGFDSLNAIDLLIANAGISAGLGGANAEPPEQVFSIFSTNVEGVFNTVVPVIPKMQARKSGQIAIMSSLAGIRGLPSCPAYAASKAAVRSFGEGLRGALKADGIRINVICPGYIRTPMTDVNGFYMPLIMSADEAAAIIKAGLEQNRPRIAFPRALYWPLLLLTWLPLRLTDAFFAALPRKISMEKA